MKISIFGLGYVGSVSAACLADAGHDVLGVDVDEKKVANINAGLSPVLEPGLPELIAEGVRTGKLRATSGELEDTDLSIVCVGPPSYENGSLCLDYVRRAVANWLNDASKSRPAWVRRVGADWSRASKTRETAWIVARALRTLRREDARPG